MTTGVSVRSAVDIVVCRASGWGAGSDCVGADRCTGGEGVEVVDGAERAGAWVCGDASD